MFPNGRGPRKVRHIAPAAPPRSPTRTRPASLRDESDEDIDLASMRLWFAATYEASADELTARRAEGPILATRLTQQSSVAPALGRASHRPAKHPVGVGSGLKNWRGSGEAAGGR